MYNTYNTKSININNNEKPEKKTITIDARYKEMYYQSAEPALKETPQVLEQRNVFWTYMTHVSMKNAISQLVQV